MSGKTSVLLLNNDSIHVNSLFDFKDGVYVNIDGNVKNPQLIKCLSLSFYRTFSESKKNRGARRKNLQVSPGKYG